MQSWCKNLETWRVRKHDWFSPSEHLLSYGPLREPGELGWKLLGDRIESHLVSRYIGDRGLLGLRACLKHISAFPFKIVLHQFSQKQPETGSLMKVIHLGDGLFLEGSEKCRKGQGTQLQAGSWLWSALTGALDCELHQSCPSLRSCPSLGCLFLAPSCQSFIDCCLLLLEWRGTLSLSSIPREDLWERRAALSP